MALHAPDQPLFFHISRLRVRIFSTSTNSTRKSCGTFDKKADEKAVRPTAGRTVKKLMKKLQWVAQSFRVSFCVSNLVLSKIYRPLIDRCQRLCNSQQANPTCMAFSHRVDPNNARQVQCLFWDISRPNLFPNVATNPHQWCSRKVFRGGASRNGLRHHYRGCYKLEPATLTIPAEYKPADALEYLRLLTPSDEVYSIQTCADRCRDFVFMSWPGSDVHAHWTKYHTRYYDSDTVVETTSLSDRSYIPSPTSTEQEQKFPSEFNRQTRGERVCGQELFIMGGGFMCQGGRWCPLV